MFDCYRIGKGIHSGFGGRNMSLESISRVVQSSRNENDATAGTILVHYGISAGEPLSKVSASLQQTCLTLDAVFRSRFRKLRDCSLDGVVRA